MRGIMRTIRSRNDRTPLIETNNNNNNDDEGPQRQTLYPDSPSIQNSSNENWTRARTRDQTRDQTRPLSLDPESLCAILGVSPGLSVVQYRPGLDSGLVSGQGLDHIEVRIEESVRAHIPQIPQMPSQLEMQRHLQDVQSAVLKELLRLGPLLEPSGLMGNVTQKYHHGLISHMKNLLLQTCTSGTCLKLLLWAQAQYFSPVLFHHPELNQDQTWNLDLILLSDWIQEAQERLTHLLETELWRQLDIALQHDQQPCESEESYIGTYVDVIQCIQAAPSAAQKFSSSLSLKLSQLCLQQLCSFTKRYKDYWFKILSKKKRCELELVTFLKILKTCKEIKKYVLTKYEREFQGVNDTVSLLEEIETFTLDILLKDLAVITEKALKKYFESNHTNMILIDELKRFLTVKLWLNLEEHKDVISKCYGLVVSLYIKHMCRFSLRRLRRRWSQHLDSSVTDDALLIHETICSRCPGVKEWNISLLFVSDVLKTEDINSIKVSTGDLLQKYKKNGLTLDKSLLFGLLRWKGLSWSSIREVLDSVSGLDADLDLDPPPGCCVG